MKPEEMYKIRDDSRFMHPSLREFHEATHAQDSGIVSFQMNEDIPFETRRDSALAATEQMKAASQKNERVIMIQAEGLKDVEYAVPVQGEMIRPTGFKEGKKYPCVLIIPGGALTTCSVGWPDATPIADHNNAVVISAYYRTIFDEHGQYPAAINDLHAMYQHIVEHADELQINKDKIVLLGFSSGAHLALALCHRLKKYHYNPRGCFAVFPIPDNRPIYPSSHVISNGWDGRGVYLTSKAWLGRMLPQDVPAEAFANNATVDECIGLPPTVIYTTESDPSVDPCMIYASKLIQAGVFTTLKVWGGANHMNLGGDSDYAARYAKQQAEDLKDLLDYDNRRPWTME